MEAVIGISRCTPGQRVGYVINFFTVDALSWWNGQCRARDGVVAEAMS